jgi:hypothetical protein
MRNKRPLDWNKLPAKLRYLAEAANKYGHFQFDNRILDYLQNEMTDEECKELIDLGKMMARDSTDITSWLDMYDITKHREAALVYFTGHLLWLGKDLGIFNRGKRERMPGPDIADN